MPREQRHARRNAQWRNGRKEDLRFSGGQRPSDGDRRGKGKFVLNASAGGRRGRGCRIRFGGRDAAIRPSAIAAGTDRWNNTADRRLRDARRLHPHQQQAKNDGGWSFHSPILTAEGPPRSYFFLADFSAASIFFMYFAGSFLKPLRQDLQQSLISRPSCVNT